MASEESTDPIDAYLDFEPLPTEGHDVSEGAATVLEDVLSNRSRMDRRQGGSAVTIPVAVGRVDDLVDRGRLRLFYGALRTTDNFRDALGCEADAAVREKECDEPYQQAVVADELEEM